MEKAKLAGFVSAILTIVLGTNALMLLSRYFFEELLNPSVIKMFMNPYGAFFLMRLLPLLVVLSVYWILKQKWHEFSQGFLWGVIMYFIYTEVVGLFLGYMISSVLSSSYNPLLEAWLPMSTILI